MDSEVHHPLKSKRFSTARRSTRWPQLLKTFCCLAGISLGLFSVGGIRSSFPWATWDQSHHVSTSENGWEVSWDKYSLLLNGRRVFVWSGEFHTWRLPVPELWQDILQKLKASGVNAISIYTHWGLSNPSRGVLDFDGYRSLKPLLDMSAQVGIWVVLRPGPYINAETTAGGIPHWATTSLKSHLRTNNTEYRDAWIPYIRELSRIVAPYQITEGGPIIAVQIENEYTERAEGGYVGMPEAMEQLKDALRANGINVPFTVNDANLGLKNYVNGSGAGDIYGFDSYPQSFDCANPGIWKPVITEYWDYHQTANPHQPLYIPEFQGGAFDAWGPHAPGYEACKTLTGHEFESVFNLNLWAQNVKMANIYMAYGGTSWGHLPFPGVYTSYDYGAAISENRDINSLKYAELKRQGLFLRSSPDFYKTDVIGNSTHVESSEETHPSVDISNASVFGTLLNNPDTGTSFYVVRQLNSSSIDIVDFRIKISVKGSDPTPHRPQSEYSLQIPLLGAPIELSGRQSKTILANYRFGDLSSHPTAIQRDYNPAFLNTVLHTFDFFSHFLLSGLESSSYLEVESTYSPTELLYSTAGLFFSGRIGAKDVLILYGDADQEHEFAIRLQGRAKPVTNKVWQPNSHIRPLSGGVNSFSDKIYISAGEAIAQVTQRDEQSIPLKGYTVFNVLKGVKGVVSVWESDTQVILYADTASTSTLWVPMLGDDDLQSQSEANSDPFRNFWSIGSNSSIIVDGPRLVRSASYSAKRRELRLQGDLDTDRETYLSVIVYPSDLRTVYWNGQRIEVMSSPSTSSSSTALRFNVNPLAKLQKRDNGGNSRDSSLTLPSIPPLEDWEYADSLPEIGQNYDDSEWITADHEKTNSPYKPHYGKKVLYGCDYGYCEGVVIWRGHFTATGNEKSVNLSINGGEAFAASVYLNDVFLATTYGNSTNNKNIIRETDETYIFPEGSVLKGKDNVITIIQDNMGLDETHPHWDFDGSKSPRGIRGYHLIGGTFNYWKVQGKFGGYENFPDKARGIYNEGGLFGERQGWHLPQSERARRPTKDTLELSWAKRDPSEGLPPTSRYSSATSPLRSLSGSQPVINSNGTSGVGFFRTTFKLDLPRGYDYMLSFNFKDMEDEDGYPKTPENYHGQPYRALLFVNGWMMGKRIGNLGPQVKFPVHEGILKYRGENTVALAIWSMSPTSPIHPFVELLVDAIYEGGIEVAD